MPTNRTFADIDFNFQAHPATGDLVRVYDLNSIKQSIKTLVLTEFYGRPFHPEIGSSVAGLLFEQDTPLLKFAIEQSIRAVIENHEPRAEVIAVSAVFEDNTNTYYVEVDYFTKGMMIPVTVDLVLERAR